MDETQHPGATTMAKVQKTLMIPDELYRLIQAIEEKTGATFQRILTGMVLESLFRGCNDTEPGLNRRDPLWMRLTTLLDRGELTVADIPGELLESNLKTGAAWKRMADPAVDISDQIKRVEEKKRSFDNAVEDFGGKTEAIVHFLTD